MSSNAHSPALVGKVVTIAGRSTPGRRPSTNRPHAIIAPELPADTTASASPDLHRSKHMRIDDFFFCFTAIDGASCMVMTSGAWRIGIFSPDAPMRSSSARTRGSSPTTITSIPFSRTAETIPSTSTRGAPSAPIASMAIGAKARAAPLPSAR